MGIPERFQLNLRMASSVGSTRESLDHRQLVQIPRSGVKAEDLGILDAPVIRPMPLA
jgi:hypothetical protein